MSLETAVSAAAEMRRSAAKMHGAQRALPRGALRTKYVGAQHDPILKGTPGAFDASGGSD
jgi:hypothetical protein